jgi:hypothetical protein
MNKKLTITLALVCVFLVVITLVVYTLRTRQAADIRNVSWGMSLAQVKQRESASLVTEKQDALIYQTNLFDYPAALGYYFNSKYELIGVKYASLRKYETFKECLSDYHEIKLNLQHQYGESVESTDENYRESVWETSRTRMTLTIGETQKPIWVLQYQQQP